MILLTLLGLVAGVTRQYAQVDRATQFGERFRILMRASLDDMLTEAQDSYRLLEPTSDTLVTKLEFLRIDARTNPTRFPPLPVPPDPLPADWEPFAPASRRTVLYHKVGENLLREVEDPGGGTSRNLVFESCSGFSGRLLPNQVLELTLSSENEGRVETRTGRARLPCL